jgi:hypothetical protein
MARDTKTHLEIHAFDPVHGFYGPMALGAANLLLDVPFVVEDHVLGQIIGLSPGGGCLGIEIPVLFLNLGMVSNNIFMAIEALLYRGHTGVFGAPHIWMTELTLDKLYTGMEMVAEGYGLLRAYIFSRHHVEEVQEKEDEEKTESRYEKRSPVSCHGLDSASHGSKGSFHHFTSLLSLNTRAGKSLRKKIRESAMSPKNPSVTNPSAGLKGRAATCGLKAGPNSRRCSNQIPASTTEQRTIINAGLAFTFLLSRMKKGTTKLMIKTVQASEFHGASMVRFMM